MSRLQPSPPSVLCLQDVLCDTEVMQRFHLCHKLQSLRGKGAAEVVRSDRVVEQRERERERVLVAAVLAIRA